MNVKDFIMHWRYKLSQMNLDGGVQENYVEINYSGALDHLNALSEETGYFFYEIRPGSDSYTNVKCAREPWKLVGIVPGEEFQNYQDQRVKITEEEWEEYKDSHENDHQQDIEGNNNDNDESTNVSESQQNDTTMTLQNVDISSESKEDDRREEEDHVEPVTVGNNNVPEFQHREIQVKKMKDRKIQVSTCIIMNKQV